MNKQRAAAAVLMCAAFAAPVTAASPGMLAVVNRGENTVSLIDLAGERPTVKLPTGDGPHEAAACGNRVLVSNYGAQTPGSSISVYDGPSRKQVAVIDVSPLIRPHGMACAGEFAYFTAEANLAVGRIRLSELKVDLVIGTGQKIGHMVAKGTSPDALFTANIVSGTVTRIGKAAGPGGWDIASVAVGKAPEGIAVSPDAKQVWAANRADSTISIVEATGMKTVDTIATGKFVFRMRFTSDGKRVIATEPESDAVRIFDAASHKLLHSVTVPGAPVSIALTADDRLAYVVAAGGGRVVEIDLEKYSVTREFPTGAGPDGVALMDPAA